ncbi:MAG: 50S ribosomal protein L2 [Planctomycetes bacterium]|nr:50S ribosomal protein L2 [Planctomycetota bacterium]
MAIIQYKPTSPGRRGGSTLSFEELTRRSPEKSLTSGKKSTGGRNSSGRRTCRHMGGGHKRKLREIDSKRDKFDIPAVVSAIEYDPNRSANIALLHYADGEKRYILAPLGIKVGTKVLSSRSAIDPELGYAMPMSMMPVSTIIHNIELNPGQGGKIVKSAGTMSRLMAREGKYCTIELPSGELRRVLADNMATVGQVGNLDHSNMKFGKAGRKRWLGVRPSVRGMAMNPVAHPMGGGEGRSKSNHHPCSPTGVLAKGGKTRRPKNQTNKYILRKRK